MNHKRTSVVLEIVAAILLATLSIHFAAPLAQADGVLLPLPDADAQEITAQLGAGVVGQALPSLPISDISVYFPLQNRTSTYQVTSGKHAGEQQKLSLGKRARPTTGQAAWRFDLSHSIASFVAQAGTDLVMPSVIDSDHDVIVVTTPANPFLLQGMKPGESRSFTQQVSVNYLENPQSQEYSGSLTGTYAYVGTYQVTVPAGTFPAILTRLKFEGKVGPAHTTDTAYYLFAPNVGVVGMISQEDVEAFWIINIDTTSGKVLAAQ